MGEILIPHAGSSPVFEDLTQPFASTRVFKVEVTTIYRVTQLDSSRGLGAWHRG